ncbi:MAG TPA: hypothetical protein VFL55_19835 [Acetobacteraceae bacterium]|nr:hypothetical protein [Acetobacteraceae bacterium]
MFADRSLINFKLLKLLHSYVDGLEVAKNTYREWEDAIFDGFQMFYRLCLAEQGTVRIDLPNREITFSHTVCPAIQGITVGLGIGACAMPATPPHGMFNEQESRWTKETGLVAETAAAKQAILEALGIDKNAPSSWSKIEVRLPSPATVSVKLKGLVRDQAFRLKAVDYKVAFNRVGTDVVCTATAIGDVRDALR